MRYLDFIGIQSNMYDDARRNLNSKGYKSLSNINIDSGNFIANYIYLIILFFVLGFIHFIIFLLANVRYIELYPKHCITRTLLAIKSAFEFSVYFYLLIVTSMFLFLVALNDIAGGNFDTAFNLISFIVSLIVLALMFIMAATPIILILMKMQMKKNTNEKDAEKENKDKRPIKNVALTETQKWIFKKLWDSYMGGLRESIFAHIFYSLLLSKYFVYAIIFILIDEGKTQLIVFIILSAIFLAYLVGARPFNHFVPNILAIANEFVILLVVLLMTDFIDNDSPSESISDAITYLLAISIIVSFIVCIAFMIYKFIQKCREPKNQGDKHEKNETSVRFDPIVQDDRSPSTAEQQVIEKKKTLITLPMTMNTKKHTAKEHFIKDSEEIDAYVKDEEEE